MADKKISELTLVPTVPLAGDYFVIARGATNYKVDFTYFDGVLGGIQADIVVVQGDITALGIQYVIDIPALQADVIAAQADIITIQTDYLPLSGGIMTGALKLSGAPTDPLHAATKTYTDAAVTTLFATKTSDDLPEGAANLYFTIPRFTAVIAAITTDDIAPGSDPAHQYYSSFLFAVDFAAMTTDGLTEGAVNKYYTNAVARLALSAVDPLVYNNITGEFTFTDPYIDHMPASTYDQLADWVNTCQSAGKITGGVISSNGDGTIAITSGTGFVKTTDSGTGVTKFFNWSTVAMLALTDNSNNYIYITYNGGAPTAAATTVYTNIDTHTEFLIGVAYRDGTTVRCQFLAASLTDTVPKILTKHMYEYTQAVLETVASCIGNRYIGVTAGVMYMAVHRIETIAMDTSAADTFTSWFYNGAAWTSTPAQTQIDNTQYDMGAGLGTLSTGNYGVHWIYLLADNTLHVVYGEGDYSRTEAERAVLRITLPDMIQKWGALIGKALVRKSAASFYCIDTRIPASYTSDVLIQDRVNDDFATTHVIDFTIDFNDYQYHKTTLGANVSILLTPMNTNLRREVDLELAQDAAGGWALTKITIFSEDFTDAEVDIEPPGTSRITVVNDVYETGTPIYFTNSGGALPAALAADTLYYSIRVDATHIRIATTRANAFGAIHIVMAAAAGGGTHHLHKSIRLIAGTVPVLDVTPYFKTVVQLLWDGSNFVHTNTMADV